MGKCTDRLFFVRQKPAYEMLRSVVGSEMCIIDRLDDVQEKAWVCLEPVSDTHMTLPTIYSV